MSDSKSLSPISSVHLKDAAYEALRDAITNLDLAPGQAISEKMLARKLGVSKTPIRAALGRLEAEGMVETIPFKGTFVSSVGEKDAADLIELRIALEVTAVKAACTRSTDEQIGELLEVARRASLDEAAGRSQSALRSIGDFHDRLVRLSGNARLVSAFSALASPLMRIRALSGAQPSSIEQSSYEHAQIIAALADRDAERAADLVTAHLRRVLDLYRRSLDVEPSEID